MGERQMLRAKLWPSLGTRVGRYEASHEAASAVLRLAESAGAVLLQVPPLVDAEDVLSSFASVTSPPKGSKIHYAQEDGGLPSYPRLRALGTTPGSVLSNIGYDWHTDHHAAFTLLLCVAMPDAGGCTLFADAEQLLTSLSPVQHALAERLCVHYSDRFTSGGPSWRDTEFGVRMSATGTRLIQGATGRIEHANGGDAPSSSVARDTLLVQPAVQYRRQGRAGEAAVGGALLLSPKYVDHVSIDGCHLTHNASQALIDELLRTGLQPLDEAPLNDQLLPEGRTRFGPAVCCHRWAPGDLLVWDNRRMLHSTTPTSLYGHGERKLVQLFCGELL